MYNALMMDWNRLVCPLRIACCNRLEQTHFIWSRRQRARAVTARVTTWKRRAGRLPGIGAGAGHRYGIFREALRRPPGQQRFVARISSSLPPPHAHSLREDVRACISTERALSYMRAIARRNAMRTRNRGCPAHSVVHQSRTILRLAIRWCVPSFVQLPLFTHPFHPVSPLCSTLVMEIFTTARRLLYTLFVRSSSSPAYQLIYLWSSLQ